MPDSDPPKPVETPPQQISLISNPLSLFGLALVALAIVFLFTFLLFQLIATNSNPYTDIIGFLVLPSILVAGLMIVPTGMAWKLWRVRRTAGVTIRYFRLPQLDFNERKTRNWLTSFVLVSVLIVLPAVLVSAYEGYHYTESTTFCGQACHGVMEPQATAHARSPHARVSCAECHIGSGAGWFVKSKLSGTRQVLAVWADSFPRPIPPAITELRPARDTCEECHWPAKFFGSQLKEVVHYSPDEANTKHTVRMLLKTGGADESIGRVEGIHMHMLQSGLIEYIATDEHLQEIPWVRYVDASGRETIFRSDGSGSDAAPPAGTRRKIDCMDCHNRGAHHFGSPERTVDQYLEVGRIDPTLPFVKREAVAVLSQPYSSVAAAEAEIERALGAFYRENYPELHASASERIAQAIEGVKRIFKLNVFPEMKVDWRVYPENIGHLSSAGCFRCHDGRHVDAQGTAISSSCETCHTFLNEVPDRPGTFAEGDFHHSMNLVNHGKLRCEQCHTGGPLPLCRDCHATGQWLEERGNPRFVPTPDSAPAPTPAPR